MTFLTTSNGAGTEPRDWVVLVVDDTPDNLSIAETVLSFSGAKVYTARNGAEGLALLEKICPTVILLDIRMPTMDGWEMYRLVRSNPQTQSIPVIALTAYAMAGDRQQIIGAGFNGYISKPYEVFSLIPQIRAVLESSRSNQSA